MSDIEKNKSHKDDQSLAIKEFIGPQADYYKTQFEKIGSSSGFTPTFNWAAALLGSIWFASRGLWNWALAFTICEIIGIVQIMRGLFGDLTSDLASRAKMIEMQLQIRETQLDKAIKDNVENLDSFKNNIRGLEEILSRIQNDIFSTEASRIWIVLLGIFLIFITKAFQGLYSNTALEKKFSNWLSTRIGNAQVNIFSVFVVVLFSIVVFVSTALQYSMPGQISFLNEFPTGPKIRLNAIAGIEVFFDFLTQGGENFFNAIRRGILAVLDALEVVFVATPWMVIIAFVMALTALSSGLRAAIFSGAFLAYMGVIGLWVLSMQTLALLGTGACICIGFGIPFGVYCARRPKVYRYVQPMLDFQQTMPAFVYMIPVIAFFGTGKPAAVVVCTIFGMPPVVRLTVLGLQGVPHSIREAAIAYGATNWYLLTKIDLPLAAKSIRTGMNQTILLSLLTVVVASLIGAKGLGEDVLDALQYASVGQGILAGFAILFIAMILDRIVQGKRD